MKLSGRAGFFVHRFPRNSDKAEVAAKSRAEEKKYYPESEKVKGERVEIFFLQA